MLKLARGNAKGIEKKAFDWGSVNKWLEDAKGWYRSQGRGTRALIGAGGGALAGTGLASILGGNKVTGALLGGTAGGVAGAIDWKDVLGITDRDKRIRSISERLDAANADITDRDKRIRSIAERLDAANAGLENSNAANKELREINRVLSGRLNSPKEREILEKAMRRAASDAFYDKYMKPNGGRLVFTPPPRTSK